MASVAVARITPADRSEWLTLFQQWQDYLSGALTMETYERAWQLLCDEGSGLFGLIARREDGQSVGLVHASLTPFACAGGPILYLQDLYVTAAARGQGVGSVLMSAVYALADEKGATQVFWLVNQEDSQLERFYIRHHAVRTRYIRFMRHDWPWFAPGTH
jgi:GNAT superfamily N-acetyltransferase